MPIDRPESCFDFTAKAIVRDNTSKNTTVINSVLLAQQVFDDVIMLVAVFQLVCPLKQ